MKFFYSILNYIASVFVKLAANFNSKLKLGVIGRKETFKILKKNITPNDKVFWFHCASLGEYEQGLPVFESLKKDYPDYKIVLSFFSPSGYEIRKNSPIADAVVYLPLDTITHAKKFIDLVHPDLVLFVKYEVWPNYLGELKKRNIPTFLISALFRKKHVYFKWYGSFMRNALENFSHIFTQDLHSEKLLESVNITNVSISGDTRFDRVSNQLKIDNTLDFVSEFKNDKTCVVIGSSWQEDEALLVPFINNLKETNVKFIIAPHNIKTEQILKLKKAIAKSVILYSEKENKDLSNYQVLILDTIGLLSKVYSYADIAYVGGAMGTTGLHNTLEPAVFGVPIIIGRNHEDFPEAQLMINNKGLFSIQNQEELDAIFNILITSKEKRKSTGQLNADFIAKNKGAVIQINTVLRKYL